MLTFLSCEKNHEGSMPSQLSINFPSSTQFFSTLIVLHQQHCNELLTASLQLTAIALQFFPLSSPSFSCMYLDTPDIMLVLNLINSDGCENSHVNPFCHFPVFFFSNVDTRLSSFVFWRTGGPFPPLSPFEFLLVVAVGEKFTVASISFCVFGHDRA